MSQVLYNYALVKSFRDLGGDYIDAFIPFALRTLNNQKYFSKDYIQHQLRMKRLNVPIEVIRSMMKRSKRRGLVEEANQEYKLTSEGNVFVNELEAEEIVEKRIESLVDSLFNYLLKQKYSISKTGTSDSLEIFINKNLEPLIFFMQPEQPCELKLEISDELETLIGSYLVYISQNEPPMYEIFKEMVFGSIISATLFSKTPSDIIDLEKKNFESCRVYLDTNFILSLLEFRPKSEVKPAKELFEILKNYGLDIRVFDFTVTEITGVMKGYIKNRHFYSEKIKVDSIYSFLKQKGISKTDAEEFIIRIESILSNKGIKIEWATQVVLNEVVPKNKKLYDLLYTYKPEQDLVRHNHDYAAIEKIREYRVRPKRRIETCQAFFLTSDGRLSRYNFKEWGHCSDSTVPEIIPDRLLTNILWLKNPSSDIPLKSIIAVHSNSKFVKKTVWNRFYDIIQKMREEGRITETNVAMLLYRGHIEDVLVEMNEEDLSRITEPFVFGEIEKATEKFGEEIDKHKKEAEISKKAVEQLAVEKKIAEEKTKEIETELIRQNHDFISHLSRQLNEREKETEKKLFDRFEKLKEDKRAMSERDSKRIALVVSLIIIGCFIIVAYYFYRFLESSNIDATTKSFIELLMSGFLVLVSVGIWKLLKDIIKTKMFNHLYLKRIREIEFLQQPLDKQ